jgi:hypothetical protein
MTPPKEQQVTELLPCPFCAGKVQARDALWPSEGDTDAVIHAGPSDCPMQFFSNGSSDKSIYAAWNCRAARQIPAGYVLVPIEPDEAMLDKGAMEIAMNQQRVITAESKAKHVYRAMLAAPPKPERA